MNISRTLKGFFSNQEIEPVSDFEAMVLEHRHNDTDSYVHHDTPDEAEFIIENILENVRENDKIYIFSSLEALKGPYFVNNIGVFEDLLDSGYKVKCLARCAEGIAKQEDFYSDLSTHRNFEARFLPKLHNDISFIVAGTGIWRQNLPSGPQPDRRFDDDGMWLKPQQERISAFFNILDDDDFQSDHRKNYVELFLANFNSENLSEVYIHDLFKKNWSEAQPSTIKKDHSRNLAGLHLVS